MTRVLIVDDNRQNLYLLRALLQGHGFAVEEACHGAEALEAARRCPPGLAISDLLMPVLDGYGLLRQWRADERLCAVPFVVYTATYTEPKDERLALDLGADAFIVKPAEPEPFLARIREVLARAGRGDLEVAAPRRAADPGLLREHNEVLVRKLESKVRQLEEANRALRREAAERERAEAELRLRDRAIRAVEQGIVITDPAGPDNPVVYAGAGFERITGYAPHEAVGRNCRFLQGRDTDPAAAAALRAAVAAGRACSVEILNYRKDGTPFWNHLSVAPVAGPDGRLAHFVGVLTDVTERRRLEEQLRQAQKVEAVGRLAGGVAHDFNNLLTVINGYSALLLARAPAGDPAADLLREIHSAGERAAGLTRQLLAFSRQQVLAPRVLDLNAVVADTEKLLRRLIGADVALETDLAPNLGPVRADPGQLGQVLMNLAVNARDAMPAGGTLTICTRNVRAGEGPAGLGPGDHVALAVSDTGCGMDEATRARAFDPFFTTKGVGQGTGLGLATVDGIVRQSRGHVTVRSAVGRGTTFTVYLPREAAPPAEASADAPADPPAVPGGTETVLLAEDEDGVRALAARALRDCGYRVLEAADGAEALRVAGREPGPIHLLVSDVVMPGLGGRPLAERLTAERPDCKVLFVSGYADDQALCRCLPGTAYLQKPFTPAALAHTVRSVLDATPAANRGEA